jgi:hypothetical protein
MPGVIVFRNYIQAAVLAHLHARGLVTADSLARITRSALEEFDAIDFGDHASQKPRLAEQYRQDARDALLLLEGAAGQTLAAEVAAIRGRLGQGHWG